MLTVGTISRTIRRQQTTIRQGWIFSNFFSTGENCSQLSKNREMLHARSTTRSREVCGLTIFEVLAICGCCGGGRSPCFQGLRDSMIDDGRFSMIQPATRCGMLVTMRCHSQVCTFKFLSYRLATMGVFAEKCSSCKCVVIIPITYHESYSMQY